MPMMSLNEFTQGKKVQESEGIESALYSETYTRVPISAYDSNLSFTNVEECLRASEEEMSERRQRKRLLELPQQKETFLSSLSTEKKESSSSSLTTSCKLTLDEEKSETLSSESSPILIEPPIVASKLRELLSPFVISNNTSSEANRINFDQTEEENVHLTEHSVNSVLHNQYDVFDTPELRYHADRLFLRILSSEVKKKISVNNKLNYKKANLTMETNYYSSPLSSSSSASSSRKKVESLCTKQSSPLQSENEEAETETCTNESSCDNNHNNTNQSTRFDSFQCEEYELEEEEEEELLLQNEKLVANFKTICRTMEDKRVDVYTGEKYWTNVTEIDELDCKSQCVWNTNYNDRNENNSHSVASTKLVKEYPFRDSRNVNTLTESEEEKEWQQQRSCEHKRSCNPLSDDSLLDKKTIKEKTSNSPSTIVIELWHSNSESVNNNNNDDKVSGSNDMEIECVYTWPTFPSLLPVHESEKDIKLSMSRSKRRFHVNGDEDHECYKGCNKVCHGHYNEHEEYPSQTGATVESRFSSNSLSATSVRSGFEYDTSTEEELKIMNVCSDSTPILTCNSGFRLPHTQHKFEEERKNEEEANDMALNVISKQGKEPVNYFKNDSIDNNDNYAGIMCSIDVVCVQDCNVKLPTEEKANELEEEHFEPDPQNHDSFRRHVSINFFKKCIQS